MNDTISLDTVEARILDAARSDMAYARDNLTAYQKRVGRLHVSEHDRLDTMGGLAYYQVSSSLGTLYDLAQAFGLDRIAKILDQHAERLKRDFSALYERDREQINMVKDAATNARIAELRGGH